MISKTHLFNTFELFSGGTGGIDDWVKDQMSVSVLDRLQRLDELPLSQVQFRQLLVLSHEAGFSPGFFSYYWLTTPRHTYDVKKLPRFSAEWQGAKDIRSIDHLYWGFYRLYVDALLYFGSIRSAYRWLREKSEEELDRFFSSRRFDTQAIIDRGPALPLNQIARDDRYLISEMACKSYGSGALTESALLEAMKASLKAMNLSTGQRITIRNLVSKERLTAQFIPQQTQLEFSVDDILETEVANEADLLKRITPVHQSFKRAREAALANTALYLSMVADLDVYVATSMRTRADFRELADRCEFIFRHPTLAPLQLRYFDPTMSAAEGHEDKGLIECLMVKCAKALVYTAGRGESYGKDAEAAMALSLGKPVIFLCDEESRASFYRETHPLSRLIDFQTGVAVGAIVTTSQEHVVQLLIRLFENNMEYEVEQSKPGYFRLKERLTQSVVRIQTNDVMLRETFWNHYHGVPQRQS